MLAQANALTQARYDFNPIEKRCLYQIIREVRRLFIDSNTGQRDLFNNMRVKLTPDLLAHFGKPSFSLSLLRSSLLERSARLRSNTSDTQPPKCTLQMYTAPQKSVHL